MPKHSGKHGHGKHYHHEYSACAPSTLTALGSRPLDANAATGATDPPNSSATAAGCEVRLKRQAEATTNRAQKELEHVAVQQPPRGHSAPAPLGVTLPGATDQPDITNVAISKKSGIWWKGEKRHGRMQRATKADDSAWVQLPGPLEQSKVDVEARDSFVATNAAASSALTKSSVDGATQEQHEEAPEGGVPEPSIKGITDGGQMASNNPIFTKEAPGQPLASHEDLLANNTTGHPSESKPSRLDYVSRKKSVTAIKTWKAAELTKTMTDLETIVLPPDRSSLQRSNRSLSRVDFTAPFLCVGIGLLFCSLIILLAVFSRHKAVGEKFCITLDCSRHAFILTNNLNRQLDPCEDYAAFVCSAWEASKDHRDLASTAMDDLRFTWYDLFEDTLSRGSLVLPAGKKPLAMYETCVNNFPKNASQFTWLRNIFRLYGVHWPKTPAENLTPLGMVVSLSYKWQWSFWITVNVFHPSSSGIRRVFVRPGRYLATLRKHHIAVVQAYKVYWEQFLAYFYPDSATRPSFNQEEIEEIRKMEGDIIESLYNVATSTRKRPALFSFNNISSYVSNVSANEWVLSFQFGLSLQPRLSLRDEIVVTDVSILQTLGKIMAKYNAVQLKKHLQWLIVQHFSIVADYSVLVRYYGSAEKAKLFLPVYCAHHVETSFQALVLGLAYYTRFAERDREIINTGFNSLVFAAVNRVKGARWMDDQSKALVTEKLMSVKNALWPPAQLLKDDVLEKIYAQFPLHEESYAHYWIKTRQAASAIHRTQEYDEAMLLLGNNFQEYASYDYVSNAAKLAFGVANPPAYYSSGTNAMLYGGLLFIMAMQLVKALDSEGIRWTVNGTIVNSTILSSPTLAKFLTREACHQGAETASAFPEVPALEVAYSAFTEYQLGLDGGNLSLGEKLPAEHVFFMTLCFLTCASRGDRNPSAANCNKIARNSDFFAEAYKCPRGSNMNPAKKCSFFIN